MIVYTFVLCLFLQAEIGGMSLEKHVQKFTYQSKLASEARGVAEGALRFIGAKSSITSGRQVRERLPVLKKKIRKKARKIIEKTNKTVREKMDDLSDTEIIEI